MIAVRQHEPRNRILVTELSARSATEHEEQREIALDGVSLAYFEGAGARPDSRTVVFAHATGFHGRTWDAVARALPGYRVLALDLRGHGRSEQTGEPDSWETFGVDTTAFMRALDLRDALGVGHSMGRHPVTIAAMRAPEAFAGPLLLDPVFRLDRVPPQQRQGGAPNYVRPRRHDWASPARTGDGCQES